MPVAQVIRFDERQAIGRPQRKLESQSMGVVLLFPHHALPAVMGVAGDDDGFAGRGRDPG